MPQKQENAATETLCELGFTGLEALAYVSLLKAPGATGYAIARAIGKPVANTYKALESLEQRGAVSAEDGAARSYRAVPVGELLSVISREFASRTAQADKALARLDFAIEDDRVYRLTGREAILERMRSLIASARSVLVVDAFPEALTAITEMLREAVKRGLTVRIKTYAPFELRGATVVTSPSGDAVMRRWDGTWLNAVADDTECLISLLGDRESHGMWTRNHYFSLVYQAALSSEVALAELQSLAASRPKISLSEALAKCRSLPLKLTNRKAARL